LAPQVVVAGAGFRAKLGGADSGACAADAWGGKVGTEKQERVYSGSNLYGPLSWAKMMDQSGSEQALTRLKLNSGQQLLSN
jgi:hypothetical protein